MVPWSRMGASENGLEEEGEEGGRIKSDLQVFG